MTASNITIAVPLLSILSIATLIDFYWHRIPNGLSLGAAMLGVVAQVTLFGAGGFASAVLGWLVCLGCFLPFYLGGGMAAGDVKLMAAAGAFLGPFSGFVACLCAMVGGAGIAAAFVLFQRAARAVRHEGASSVENAGQAGIVGTAGELTGKIPYAGAIAAGTAAVVLQPPFLTMTLPIGGWA